MVIPGYYFFFGGGGLFNWKFWKDNHILMTVYCFNIYNFLMNIYTVCFWARGGNEVINPKHQKYTTDINTSAIWESKLYILKPFTC